jgi:SAM-dependent methyltransferase
LRDQHTDRARAESFGSVAEDYDRLRPSPPRAFLEDLLALRPSRALDVGCGTGKVAGALAARGVSVLGVELDERMAALAPVPVEIASFEDWDPRGRTFDLITFGDSWHWIDPEQGWRKIAQVLAPGGAVVRSWNTHEVDEPLRSAFLEVHKRVIPELDHEAPPPGDDSSDPRVERLVYEWSRTFSADEWVRLIATYSVNQVLEPSRLAELQDGLRAAIAAHGGTVTARYTTRVSRSRAAPR